MQIVVDFDCTLTINDTLHLIAKSVNNMKLWERLSEQYVAEHNEYMVRFGSSPQTISEYLTLIDDGGHIERSSIERIAQSRVLSGTTRERLYDMGRHHVQLRPHAMEFLTNHHDDIWILSTNWSKDLIHG